jgi:hypothetical protein
MPAPEAEPGQIVPRRFQPAYYYPRHSFGERMSQRFFMRIHVKAKTQLNTKTAGPRYRESQFFGKANFRD